MFFGWLDERRRKRILEHPFPTQWDDILARRVAHVAYLDDDERAHLRQLVQVFVAEKSWEGLGGLEMTDEIRVTIAAEACLLILALEHALYRQVESILVYPKTVVAPPRPPSFFARPACRCSGKRCIAARWCSCGTPCAATVPTRRTATTS
jgi:MtfA peptidase